jgi:hypothetical protein
MLQWNTRLFVVVALAVLVAVLAGFGLGDDGGFQFSW